MVCDMNAAARGNGRDTDVAASTVALRVEVFKTLAAEKGAGNDVQRAKLIGVDRATIRRMCTGQFNPRLAIAMRMAERLGTTVDELFERVAA